MKSHAIVKSLLFAGALLAANQSALANDTTLFAPLTLSAKAQASDRALSAIRNNPSTRELSLVNANADLISETTQRLHLNLGRGLDLHASLLSAYRTADGMTVWSGLIEESSAKLLSPNYRGPNETLDDPLSSIILVRNGDRLTGNIQIGEDLIQIRPLQLGGHALIGKNHAAMPKDHPESFDRASVTPMPASTPSDVTAAANSIIRVLVNYTPAAAAASGDISGLIALAVAETNQSYSNSGIGITLELASSSLVSYSETGDFDVDLARYRTPGDGHMDSIHAERDANAADVGVLIVNNTAYCGLASGIGSTAATAFAEVYWDCATGYYSFGHEIGHLQSARHDPRNDPTSTPYAYGHGYQYVGKGKNAATWRTVMAYNCSRGCPRLQYWSNPNVTYGGVPMGTASSNDNHRVLNNTAATIAAFR